MTFQDYVPDNAGIATGQLVQASHLTNNFSLIQASINAANQEGRELQTFKASLERGNYVRTFNINAVSTSNNSISIASNAVVLFDRDANTEQVGWPPVSNQDVSGLQEGYIWAVYPGKTYAFTSRDPADKPSDGYRLALFSNAGGTVQVEANWVSPLETKPNIFEAPIRFNADVSSLANLNVRGNFFLAQGLLPRNYLEGLVPRYLSPTSLQVEAGVARNDADDGDLVLSTSSSIDVATNGLGGLDLGSVAADTLHDIWLIGSSAKDLPAGVIASRADQPLTFPTDYDRKRLIGKFRTNSSSQVTADTIFAINPFDPRPILDIQVADNDATIEFDGLDDDTYRYFEIDVLRHRPATTNDINFVVRTRAAGNTAFDAGSSDYRYGWNAYTSEPRPPAQSAMTLSITDDISTTTNRGERSDRLSWKYIKLNDMAGSSTEPTFYVESVVRSDFNGDSVYLGLINGVREAAGIYDAIQFSYLPADDIGEGIFILRGVK